MPAQASHLDRWCCDHSLSQRPCRLDRSCCPCPCVRILLIDALDTIFWKAFLVPQDCPYRCSSMVLRHVLLAGTPSVAHYSLLALRHPVISDVSVRSQRLLTAVALSQTGTPCNKPEPSPYIGVCTSSDPCRCRTASDCPARRSSLTLSHTTPRLLVPYARHYAALKALYVMQ